MSVFIVTIQLLLKQKSCFLRKHKKVLRTIDFQSLAVAVPVIAVGINIGHSQTEIFCVNPPFTPGILNPKAHLKNFLSKIFRNTLYLPVKSSELNSQLKTASLRKSLNIFSLYEPGVEVKSDFHDTS